MIKLKSSLQKAACFLKAKSLLMAGGLLVVSNLWATNLPALYINVEHAAEKVPLATVVRAISEQTSYEFSYDDDLMEQQIEFIEFDAKHQPIGAVLEKIFSDAEISYRIVHNRIFLKDERMGNATRQATASVPSVTQQRKTVTGMVTDAIHEPVIGANIMVKGTSNGTITDVDGRFSLSDVPEDALLVVSYIGYMEQEIPLRGQTHFQIVLKEDSQALNEVVVVGYGVQKKVNLTGSITAINATELGNIATSNLSNTLAGRAPGINITGNSGMIGASSNIRIRGGFDDPLFVIDGIVRDKEAFDVLEANEIDQLSFLKDAATASIYGSQAGNGVVLVTTRGGTVQKPVFNYQASYTFMNPTMELMGNRFTATDELIYQNRVAAFQGLATPNGDTEFDYFKNRDYNVNDYIWQNPWNTKHSISVSGGSEQVTYYALLSYIGEEGSYKNLENEKFNLRSNVTARITNRIKMNVNLSANQQNEERFYWPFSDDDEHTLADLYRCTFNWPKTYPFYLHKDGTPADKATGYPVQTPMGSWQAWNVIDQVTGDRYIKKRKREFNGIISLDIDLGDWLPGLSTRFSANYIGQDYSKKKYLTFQKNYVWNAANPDDNRFIPAPPDPNQINVFTFDQSQEFLSYDIHSLWSEQLNWFLNYDNTFEKHGVSATIVWEQASNGGEKVLAKGEDPLTNYDQMFAYSSDAERRYGNAEEVTGGRLSWIGRFNYNYDQRYIAEFSF
ncbi:MAG: SusC/RagA family TonB-linked outer membrane protein [Tannerellaceae bacterium]|nr:SusC/RagA family TonB-linked outer membrane protein [Tannerellaceae bacterium]